ncbi:hypothetical protein [Bacillus sp. FJAT-45037]|uniref:hypothetical protein n=1 Tax=Bacillus sp. FJAT-45037 TaxID=2011007 RepID=UPI000C235641|nr:hypothetical protein [Bacillus sp. FJAT-45037]
MSTKRKSVISGLIFLVIFVGGIFANGYNEEMTHKRVKDVPGQIGIQQYQEEDSPFGPREYLRVIQTRSWLNEEGEQPE